MAFVKKGKLTGDGNSAGVTRKPTGIWKLLSTEPRSLCGEPGQCPLSPILGKRGDSFRKRSGYPGSPHTIFLVRILVAHDGAAPEYHLVLGQRPRLVREDVLDLAQVLCDVEGTTLDG